ncbi:MAG: hypothetical protein Ta2E_00980 [Mycoplasmoidaceae bacterium]|nr:MAG: hypothetical protein Ta2E_00980 [Mycoplasmoidaceae bacterium]
MMKVFICDKPAANFFKQVRKYCKDPLISVSFDFVYETNILGATFGEAVKYRYTETFTAAKAVEGESSEVCDTYIIIANGTAQWTNINVIYDIAIPMTTFNLLAIIKYLLTFFGTWKIEFVRILETHDNKSNFV